MNRLFDYSTLIRQRNRCADRYFSETGLPLLVEKELLERLSILTLVPENVLVLGAVSVSALEGLCTRFPNARLTVSDCAGDMLGALQSGMPAALQSRLHFDLQPVLEIAPENGPYDLVFSNLYLPVCDDLNVLFSRLHQVMRADGCLHFSSLGPDSFAELHSAWTRVDPAHPFHTLTHPDMHDVGDALVHAGFREPVMDRDNYTLTYSTASALLQDLRNHGVCNGFSDRHKGLTGRRLWSQFLAHMEQHRRDNRLLLTLELVIGQAWRGDGLSQQRRSDGAVGISLEALAHRLKNEHGDG